MFFKWVYTAMFVHLEACEPKHFTQEACSTRGECVQIVSRCGAFVSWRFWSRRLVINSGDRLWDVPNILSMLQLLVEFAVGLNFCYVLELERSSEARNATGVVPERELAMVETSLVEHFTPPS